VDYFEAVFKDSNDEYHRVAWRKGETARVWLPPGDYSTFNDAVLLAGRHDDRTLLATGKLTAANPGSPAAIDGNTISLTFTLTALECKITDAADGGFRIIKPDGVDPLFGLVNYAGNHDTTVINRRGVPYFKVPKGGAVEAALYISGVPSETVPIQGIDTLVEPLKLAGTPVLTSVGYAAEGNPPSRVDPQTVGGWPVGSGVRLLGEGGNSLFTPEAPDPDAGKTVKLFLETGNIDGWCALGVNIPLSAYGTDLGHDVWRLRTGLNHAQLDNGMDTSSGSPGGLTLLRVGNPQGDGLLVVPGWSPASSRIRVSGRWYRLMEYPAWANSSVDGRAAKLTANWPTDVITIDGLSFRAEQVEEVILSEDLAGLTAVPARFLAEFDILTAVDLSGLSGVTSVGGYFLYDCDSLTSVDLRPLSSVTRINGTYFLGRCFNLASLDLRPLSGVTSLGDGFLVYCSSLRSLDFTPLTNLMDYVPPSTNHVYGIGVQFLTDCSGLERVDMGSITTAKFATPGFCFEDTGNGPVKVPVGQRSAYQSKFAGEINDTNRFVESW
jgi:hypothetical protein